MTPSARVSAAIEILDRILDGSPAEQALLRWSRASRFAGSGDRAAVRDLVFEALRRRGSLSALGGALTGRGLMIGLCRERGEDANLVFTGEGHAPAPLTGDERAVQPGHGHDLPDWLLPLWRQSLGADAAAMEALMGQRAPVWLRVNPLRATPSEAAAALAADGIETAPDARLATALRVTAGERRIATSRPYREGMVELQDLSPQMACAVLPLSARARVLDYCAGGGGKALALAGRAPGLDIVAYDADSARMRDLPERAGRAGARVTTTQRPEGKFDLVVADVPCSGSGTWRRTPDAKWRLTQDMLDGLLAVQAQILDSVAPLVQSGGHLAYMTCSLLEAENSAQVEGFLARHPDFVETSRHAWSPLTASDGFFLSVLMRAA